MERMSPAEKRDEPLPHKASLRLEAGDIIVQIVKGVKKHDDI